MWCRSGAGAVHVRCRCDAGVTQVLCGPPGLYHHRGEEPQPGVLADAVALVPRAVHENDGLEGEYTSSSSSSYNTTTSSLPAPLHYGGEGGGGGAGEDQEGGGGGVGGDGGVRVQGHLEGAGDRWEGR